MREPSPRGGGLRASGLWFPLLIVGGFLGLSVLANVVLVVRATGDPSFAVEEDYYGKARRWDEHQAALAASARLGWRLRSRWVQGPDGPELELRLRDGEGEPVTGLRVRIELFHAARAARRFVGVAREESEGVYRFVVSAPRAGLWVVRIEAERGSVRWIGEERATLRLEGGPR